MPIKKGNDYVIRLYKDSISSSNEVKTLKDNSTNNLIHKRITVTFNSNGGSAVSPQTRTWGVENITTPSEPSKTNHSFKGWYTKSSGGTKITLPLLAGDSDITYYAQWEGTSPQLLPPIIDSKATNLGSGNYSIKFTNPNDFNVTLYANIESTSLLRKQTIYANSNDNVTFQFISGFMFTIYAEFRKDGYETSGMVSQSFSALGI